MAGKRNRFLHRFLRNRLAAAGLLYIGITLLLALLAALISPDHTPMANDIKLQLAAQPPGFTVRSFAIPLKEVPQASLAARLFTGTPAAREWVPIVRWEYVPGQQLVRLYEYTGMDNDSFHITRDVPLAAFPGITGDSAKVTAALEKEYAGEKTFWLGTDRFGRDMLSRMIFGTRISLSVGFVAVSISLFLGILLGCLAGYYGGRVDRSIMWLINVIWSLPTLLLVIALSLAIGKGFWQIFIAVGLSMWVDVARIVRGQVMSIREKEFVEAARVLGFSDLRIIFRHILPNITGPIIVVAAANFASAILLEAGLSFLGLGVQPPMPSWGMMIKEHYGYIVLDSFYLAIVPGMAIMLLVMSFNFVGNGLRDALDIKMK